MDNLNYGFEILENIMLQMGTQFFTKDEGMASFASSVGVSPNGSRKNFGAEAVNFFTSFSNPQYKNYSWNGILANKNKEGRDFDAFIKGKTSIVFGFSRDLSRIKNMLSSQSSIMGKTISEKNIKVDFFPQMEDGKRLVIAKVLGFAVPKTARSPELSWSFLKFLAKKEMATSFHDATKLPTARLDLIVEQASDPELGFFVRQAKFAKNNFLPQPISKKELKSGLIFVVQEIINKKSLSSLSFLKNLENKMSKELEEYFSLEKLIKRPVQKQKKK
jgi:ABC-type glycerol-3-phosphate transport system substrate-binding protein